MTGKFITFEGGEGAGKSTQIRRLASRLAELGIPVTVTREPGGTPIGEAIRGRLLSGTFRGLGAEAEALLFSAARADHVDQLIRPALASGDWVLCDRFTDSTRVYQGDIGHVDPTVLDALDRASVGPNRPDLTIVLDVPAKVGLERVRARIASTGEALDRFESDDIALHERRRRAFLDIAAGAPERCAVIDASRPEEAVFDDIWSIVEARLFEETA